MLGARGLLGWRPHINAPWVAQNRVGIPGYSDLALVGSRDHELTELTLLSVL